MAHPIDYFWIPEQDIPPCGEQDAASGFASSVDASAQPPVCFRDLAQTILPKVHKKPQIPALMKMVLALGPFRSYEIRAIIKEMFPRDFRSKNDQRRLKENVKHNLSRCKCFVKLDRTRDMAGKGGLWSYDPSPPAQWKRAASRPRHPRASTTQRHRSSITHTSSPNITRRGSSAVGTSDPSCGSPITPIDEAFAPSISHLEAPFTSQPTEYTNVSHLETAYYPYAFSVPRISDVSIAHQWTAEWVPGASATQMAAGALNTSMVTQGSDYTSQELVDTFQTTHLPPQPFQSYFSLPHGSFHFSP